VERPAIETPLYMDNYSPGTPIYKLTTTDDNVIFDGIIFAENPNEKEDPTSPTMTAEVEHVIIGCFSGFSENTGFIAELATAANGLSFDFDSTGSDFEIQVTWWIYSNGMLVGSGTQTQNTSESLSFVSLNSFDEIIVRFDMSGSETTRVENTGLTKTDVPNDQVLDSQVTIRRRR
jgi:hypothetical protein